MATGTADAPRRAARSRLGPVVLVVVAVLAVAVGSLLVARARPRDLVAPPGPWPVGRAIVQLGPGPGGRASGAGSDAASLWVWYPAQRAVAADAYVPGAWRAGAPAVLGTGIAVQDLDTVRAHAGAPVAMAAGPRWPLVVLTPGMAVQPWLYTTLAEGLASRGYVVVETVPATTPWSVRDGRPVPADPGARTLSDDELVTQQARTISATVDALSDPSRRWGELDAGRIDTAAAVFAGHSLGGAASVEACRVDRRCRGAVDLDGALHGDVVRLGLSRPVLFVGAQTSCTEGSICTMPGSGPTRAARYVLTVTGSEHMDFTDSPQLFVAPGFRSSARLGSVDGPRMAAVTDALVAAFVEEAFGGPGTVAAVLRSPYPEVDRVRVDPRPSTG